MIIIYKGEYCMDKKWRNLIYIAISAICIIAIIVAVYSQFFAKKVVTVKQVNNVQEDDTDEVRTVDYSTREDLSM